MKRYFLVSLCLLCTFCFSQNREVSISGTVYLDSIAAEAAVITIQSKLKTVSGITDKNGNYSITSFPIEKEEEFISIEASYFGYATQKKKFEITESNTLVSTIYLRSKVQDLDEVVIKTDAAAIKKEVNKLSYTVNKKNFVKNTKATSVLNDVPSLSYSKENGIKIDGRRSAKIYIDGMEAVDQELETLDVSEMKKVEVLYNPSARYGSEFTGGIITITTQERDQLYYKGYLELGKGLLLKSNTFSPQLTFKTRRFIFKGFFYGIDFEQEVGFDLDRKTSTGESYSQTSFRNPNIDQKSGNIRMKYKASEKDQFFVNGSYVLNDVDGVFNGFFETNSTNPIQFSNDTGESYEQYILDGIYERKIKDNLFYTKFRYWTYTKNNFFSIKNNGVLRDALDTASKIDEFSGEITYEIPKAEVMNTDINFVFGLKYITRKFTFLRDPFFLDQNIYNAFSDITFRINKKISVFSSFSVDNTINTNDVINRNTINFLPTTTVNYTLSKKSGLAFSYARRIRRPNAYDLNENEIQLNPGVIEKGNENLSFQIENKYSVRYGKSIGQRDYLSVTPYFENTRDAILQSISQENDFLVYSKDNIGKVSIYGIALGYSGPLFEGIRTNLNFGVKYNEFKNIDATNSGATFYGNLYLSANVFKDKVSFTFSGSTNNPSYTFVSRTTSLPYTNLSMSTNIFKEKVTLSISYANLFQLNSRIRTEVNTDQVYQLTNIDNNNSNITLSLSYNFGKYFNDRFRIKSIQNNDVKN